MPEYRVSVGGSYCNFGILVSDGGQPAESLEWFEKAIRTLTAVYEQDRRMVMAREFLRTSHWNRAVAYDRLRKYTEAINDWNKSIELSAGEEVPQLRRLLARSHNSLGLLLTHLGKRPEAEEQYRKALAIREKLAAEFPAVPQYQVDLGGSYCNLGRLVSNSGQPGESLEWFEKAIRTLTAVYEQDRRSVAARQFLRNSHWNRAMAYDRLRKFAEAIKDWDKAIELSPRAEQPAASRGTCHIAGPSRSGGRGRGGGRRADEVPEVEFRSVVRLCLRLRRSPAARAPTRSRSTPTGRWTCCEMP